MLRTVRTAAFAGLLLLPLSALAQPGLVAVEILPVEGDGILPDLETTHATVAGAHGIAPIADWIARSADGRALHVRLWGVPDGESLEALRHDERCAGVGHAGHESHGWLLTKARSLSLLPAELAWIELVVPREGYGLRERAAIERAAAPLAMRYGIRPQTSLIALHAAEGPWQGVVKVELWAVPDREALERLHRDPEWIELAGRLRDLQRPHALSGLLAEAR